MSYTRPAPQSLRLPARLLKRIKATLGKTDNFNRFMAAAAFHFLTLTDAERDMVIRDYANQKGAPK